MKLTGYLASMLGAAMSARFLPLPDPRFSRNRGKGKGGVPSLFVLHHSIGRGLPERPRHWHNLADPIQAARIEAAREKRERKAKLRSANAWESRDMNLAHHSYALDPFHVVRS